MSGVIAALPMYDWPERRGEVDAQWAALRDHLRARGVDAPQELSRRTGDLLDFWKRPDLLFSQTCWGPMEQGLDAFAQVLGQPSYDGIEGGDGELYSSAIIMRRADVAGGEVAAPAGAEAVLPVELMRGRRFAYNVPDSMSGIIGITRDLEAVGEDIGVFSELIETGGHRGSIRAVADGRADVAAIDCLSWDLAQKYEPPARELVVVGWTAKRKGLPYISAKDTAIEVVEALREALRF
ncbi:MULTISPECIES: phosphate/phosphite/phosphonate ABC transporter substrate-binding protein [Mesorhizobium]|uniref:Phosphate ABC transporter substrate-binding protein n=1 Tax=Mesorhizobium denitrificans TaxID=2294114 RepID=A0A371XGX7_9HYPH|nr:MULTISPECIES: PhnD/SsuA/transferrin family substrate-binding protein [Mesorhizobium]RFC68304.1 phosphate ABC transporter substrate-binding protein [Mesorhizobium denitrificans]